MNGLRFVDQCVALVPRRVLRAAANVRLFRWAGRKILGQMDHHSEDRPILTISHGPLRGYRIRHNPYTEGERVWLGVDETHLEPILRRLLSPGMVAYDLGAAVGLYAMQMGRLVGPAGRVIACEPCPDVFPLLSENVSLNHLTNIQLVETAISDQCGTAPFAVHGEKHFRAGVSVGGTLTELGDKRTVPVRVCTLDTLIYGEGYPVPQFLKLDIQRAEAAALRGAERLLREAAPKFIISLHSEEQAGSVYSLLAAAEYSITVARNGRRVTSVEEAVGCSQEDFVAVRQAS
jgi:FkbM family methyltransferase